MKPDPDTLVSRAEGSIGSSVFTDDESGMFPKDYLADASVYERLRADEQIHYLLVTDSSGVEIASSTSPKSESIGPDAGLHGVAAVTDQRILIVIGRDDGDRVVELEPVDVAGATRKRGLFSTTVVFKTTTESATGTSTQTTYSMAVKRRKSSDAGDAVEYVRQHHAPVAFTGAGDETTSAELRANGGVSTGADEINVIETEFVDDASSVPEQSLQQLADAVGTVRHLDFGEVNLNEAISTLETARDQLSATADEPGLSTETIQRGIDHVESTLESLEKVRSVQARVDRKLVLIDKGIEVPDATLSDLLDSIEDATEVTEDLGLGTEILEERRATVAEQLDESSPDGPESRAHDPTKAAGEPDSGEWEWAGDEEDESEESDADEGAETGRTDGETGDSDSVPSNPSREDLVKELHRVEAEIGKTPTPIYVRKYARYDKQVFLDEFGSWDFILDVVADEGPDESESGGTASSESATDETTQTTASRSGAMTADAESSSGASGEPSREAVLEDIERIADQLGRHPKLADYASHGTYTKGDVYAHFDSWTDAVEASDVDTASREELLDELERLESELGFPPQMSHVDEHGEYTSYAYNQEFGSVDSALEEAGFDVESHVRECLADVVASTAGNPRMSDFAEHSPYSPNKIYKYWDSWGDALDDVQSEDSDGDSEAEPEVIQNELSELYEQHRNLRALCGAVVDASEDADGNDANDPIRAWLERLKSYPTDESSDAAAYGAQQRDRNPFSMGEYREEFGTGDRVTEFAKTDARPPTTVVQTLLDSMIDGDPAEFYLPVDSQTGARFPVFVESQSELDRAVQMLERLPERPSAASASGTPDSGTETGTEPATSAASGSSPGSGGAGDDLTEMNGVTEEIAEALAAEGYTTRDDLKEASIDELADVDAIGRQIALRIKLNVSD